MPKKEGRTGNPGNSTVYHKVEIATSRPELLQSGIVRPKPMSVSNVSIPKWEKGKANNKASGLKNRKY